MYDRCVQTASVCACERACMCVCLCACVQACQELVMSKGVHE
jgi:hypothetical protein